MLIWEPAKRPAELRVFTGIGRQLNGALTFKIVDRQSSTEVAPQFLGLDGGALSITGTAFNDSGLLLTNLFWTQRAENGSWILQFGRLMYRTLWISMGW
jgi:hypothetical protein